MLKWLLVVGGLILLWYLVGIAWKKVIQPYFRQEVIEVRTSVIPS